MGKNNITPEAYSAMLEALTQLRPLLSLDEIARRFFHKDGEWLDARIKGHDSDGRPTEFSAAGLTALAVALHDIAYKLEFTLEAIPHQSMDPSERAELVKYLYGDDRDFDYEGRHDYLRTLISQIESPVTIDDVHWLVDKWAEYTEKNER